MKINRVNDPIPDWMKEYTDSINKKAFGVDGLDGLRRPDSVEKFSTIDEKMNDIKARIGFNLIKQNSDDNLDEKVACKSKTAKISESDVSRMERILKYIKDLIEGEPNISTMMILNRCKNDPELGFDSLSINMEKLEAWIGKKVKKVKNDDEGIGYVNLTSGTSPTLYTEDPAPYFEHAEYKR